MPLRESTIAEITALTQRYCAVENGDEAPQDGYFSLTQGKNQKSAKQARAPVKFGEFARTTDLVLRRVTELSTNGEGHVFVKVYESGNSHPLEVLRIEGTTDASSEDDDVSADSGAVPALVGGILKMANTLVAENREWKERAFRGLDQALVEREQLTMSLMHNQLLESQGEDQRMNAALAALAPTIEAVTPAVLDALLKFAGGKPGAVAELPADPGARFEALVGRMVGAAQELGGVAQNHPDAVTPERAANLFILMKQLAPFLGLTVTGYPGEPLPPEAGSPA